MYVLILNNCMFSLWYLLVCDPTWQI